MIGLAFEKVHCTPEELLVRMSSKQIAEAMAYFQLENEEAEAARRKAQAESKRANRNKGSRRRRH
jgi:hypothetical protein